jgi:NADH-quinone oxidoreductase subunit F
VHARRVRDARSACYIYIRGDYVLASRRPEKAIAEAYAPRLRGKNVLRSGWDCELVLHVGAGAYICGERTRS